MVAETGTGMMYQIYGHQILILVILFVKAFVATVPIGIPLIEQRFTVHLWLHRGRRANEMVSLAMSSYFVLYGILLTF
jgi:hypothetical protein